MYKTVYAPNGEMFEVPQHIFEDVVLNKGWTQTPQSNAATPVPQKIEKEEKNSKRSSVKSYVKKSSSEESLD